MYCVIMQITMAVNIPITASPDVTVCGVVDRCLTTGIQLNMLMEAADSCQL